MNRTPIIPAGAARCRPGQPCAMKHKCARFLAEIAGSPLQTVGCAGYLPAQAFEPQNLPKPEREVKPWIGDA